MSNIENTIKTKIKKLGPMTVKDFFNYTLYDKKYGYYSKKNILGKNGDFITAPETSQLFGETIAVWLVLTLSKYYKNEEFHLCELGPGKGTLMSDLLRTVNKIDSKIYKKIKNIFFLESTVFFSNNLKSKFTKAQVESDIGKLPRESNIIIANEFFDAIPVNQYVYKKNNWYEKLVSLDKNNNFQFIISKKNKTSNTFFPKNPKENQVFEFSEYIINLLTFICANIRKYGGVFLIIDYAKTDTDCYGTLSVINKHKHVKPFFKLGESDISFKPDFNLIAKVAKENNCTVHASISQSNFLQNMGIVQRCKNLVKTNPKLKEPLLTQLEKLISSKYMGETFKIISISNLQQKKMIGFNE